MRLLQIALPPALRRATLNRPPGRSSVGLNREGRKIAAEIRRAGESALDKFRPQIPPPTLTIPHSTGKLPHSLGNASGDRLWAVFPGTLAAPGLILKLYYSMA